MDGIQSGQKAFLIGIGGIGMSALAVILKKRGFPVAGSDRAQSTITAGLSEQGIEIRIGHQAANITPDCGFVVYTNAISAENPELVRAQELGLPLYERAQMLEILASPKFSIGVSGTHGKTTTTSMVSRIFLKAGLDPTLAVGGFLSEINGSGYEGTGKYFIYEACEAYASFLKLRPNIALMTNVDADHLDFYGDFQAVQKAFRTYIRENIPPYGILIYNEDDAPLRKIVAECAPSRTISVGIRSRGSDYAADRICLRDFSSRFRVRFRGRFLGDFEVNIPGRHNVTNALLAIAAARASGISLPVIRESLAQFRNADRRFQLKLSAAHLTVIDDYAHHPAEIDATLSAARNLSQKKRAQVIAVFQPHLYSRTQLLYKDFARSLSKADRVVLTDVYAARETNDHNVSSRMIYDEVVKMIGEKNVAYADNLGGVPDKVRSFMNGNNIVITLGAGDVWKISDLFANHH